MPTPEDGGNWGVLGGTFDPVHNGHLNLARSICRIKKLDGVLFIPSLFHPNKEKAGVASFDDRVAMLELGLTDNPDFIVSQIEKLENLSGYTIDTLNSLKKRFSNAKFYFIIGEDLIGQLSKWHRGNELLSEFSFLAGGRPGNENNKSHDHLIESIEVVEIEEVDISASNIRKQIAGGAFVDDIKKLVPSKVADYIFQKNLYK